MINIEINYINRGSDGEPLDTHPNIAADLLAERIKGYNLVCPNRHNKIPSAIVLLDVVNIGKQPKETIINISNCCCDQFEHLVYRTIKNDKQNADWFD